MEKALAAIHQANHLRQPMSLEFGTQEGRVALFLRSLHKMEELIVGPITANYPNSSITTVEPNEPCPTGRGDVDRRFRIGSGTLPDSAARTVRGHAEPELRRHVRGYLLPHEELIRIAEKN